MTMFLLLHAGPYALLLEGGRAPHAERYGKP